MARGLGGVALDAQIALSLAQLGDVAEERHAAAGLGAGRSEAGPPARSGREFQRALPLAVLFDDCLGEPFDDGFVHRLFEQGVLRAHRGISGLFDGRARRHDIGNVAIHFAIGGVALDQSAVLVPDADAAGHAAERIVEQRLRGLGAGAGAFGFGLLLLELGDIAVDAEQAAIGQRLEVELDDSPGSGPPFVARATRCQHGAGAFFDHRLDFGIVGGRSEVAAAGLVAQNVVA